MKQKGYLLLPLLLWAGCGRSTPPPDAPAHTAQVGEPGAGVKETKTSDGGKGGASTDYLPLEIGRTMVYDVTWELPGLKAGQATATGAMVECVEVDGKAYFKQTTTVSGIPYNLTKTGLFRRTPHGIYQIWEGEEESGEWLYLPTDVKLGDEWTSTSPSGAYQFRAEGFEDVETPSGLYRDCLKLSLTIKATLTGGSDEQWLAPGIGVVKQVDRNRFFSSTTLLKAIKRAEKTDSL